MTLMIGDYVSMQTGGFWKRNPNWPQHTYNPFSRNTMYAAYSSTASPTAEESRWDVAEYTQKTTGGFWKVASADPTLPSEPVSGPGSWAYAADQATSTTQTVPTDWPPGWTFPGPVWPPGWERTVTGAITCEVTAPATVIYSVPTCSVSVSFFNPSLTPAVVCLGQICRISATINGATLNIRKSSGAYATTLDYVMSLYDGTNYGISESITAELTIADVGRTIEWTAQSLGLTTNATDTESTLVMGGCP